MRSCKVASELTAIEGHRRLSLSERISLGIHRVICAPCRAYKKQFRHFNKAMQQINEQDVSRKFNMDDQVRQRISDKMKQSQQETR